MVPPARATCAAICIALIYCFVWILPIHASAADDASSQGTGSATGVIADQIPSGLMCELMAAPEKTFIFDMKPEYSWIVPGTARGDIQTAYQILVATSERLLNEAEADIWNSGKVTGNASIAVEHGGTTLKPDNVYFWKVRTWNGADNASLWSRPQKLLTKTPLSAADGRFTTARYPLEETLAAPVSASMTGKGSYFIDFGKAAFGTLSFTVDNKGETDDIIVILGEDVGPGKKVREFPAGSIRYKKIKMSIEHGKHTYRVEIPPDSRNTGNYAVRLPDYIGEVMPFRYCELKGLKSDTEISPSDIRQVRVHYPFDHESSLFQSSAPVLNDVWDLCKRSIFATSFAGVYVDGDRERIPYEADAYINQLSHYAVDREYTLARYSHERLLQNPTWPTEWALHSVLMAWADYMYTGDRESLREFYDVLKAKTLHTLARKDGLISARVSAIPPELIESLYMNNPRYIFSNKLEDLVDWPQGERDGFVFTDYNAVVNAFHYRALVIMAQVARDLGMAGDSKFFLNRSELARESFNSVFFNPETGLYVDGDKTLHSSLHANMFALAFGLVPDDRKKKTLEFIKSKGMACSVYAAQYLLEALYDAGEDEHALGLMTDTHTDRSWPHMLYDIGSTITLEAWDMKYKANLDWNHAWGAAPANIIPRKLMGIEPLEPGFRRVRIRPMPGELKTARAVTPTIRGPVEVEYEKEPNGSRNYKICIPANTEAEVHLPAERPEDVLENGTPAGEMPNITFLRLDQGRIVFGIKSGCYSFSI
ncbi:MAG: alpha-L-rhamnosidase C-terminal domain-containing protein [bacterium]